MDDETFKKLALSIASCLLVGTILAEEFRRIINEEEIK